MHQQDFLTVTYLLCVLFKCYCSELYRFDLCNYAKLLKLYFRVENVKIVVMIQVRLHVLPTRRLYHVVFP